MTVISSTEQYNENIVPRENKDFEWTIEQTTSSIISSSSSEVSSTLFTDYPKYALKKSETLRLIEIGKS